MVGGEMVMGGNDLYSPVPYCFDCKSAARQELQETVGYIVIIMLLIDRMGVCYSVSRVSFMW